MSRKGSIGRRDTGKPYLPVMNSTILGRGEPTSAMHAQVDRTVRSHGGLLLIGGEAGIGKTTLVGDLVSRARDQGAIAVVGTCSSSAAAPALWPWTQIVRALKRALGPEEFAGFAAEAGLETEQLIRLRGQEQDDDGDPQFALFDATASMLSAIAHHRPLVLVLEDLHWADRASVELLEFIARHCWFEPILAVGTYRDTEVSDPAHPLHSAIANLSARATLIEVPGLTPDAVAALVKQTSGAQPEPDYVLHLHRRTGGNPFFVEQTARLWAGGQGPDALPTGVMEAVRRRVQPLPPNAVKLLRAAAILQSPVTAPMLGAVAGLKDSVRTAGLVSALTARLLRVNPAGEYEFVHDLVRETVTTDLPQADEAHLHAAVVRALGEHPNTVLPGDAAAHALAAGDAVSNETTTRLLRAAAQDADSRLSGKEAVDYYRRAAQVCSDPDAQLGLELELVGALSFDAALNRRPVDEAVDLLRSVIVKAADAPAPIAARVALAAQGYDDLDIDEVDPLMRRAARELLGVQDLPHSTAELAGALALGLADNARAGDDDEALTEALSTYHHMLWGPGTSAQREDLMVEILAAARRRGDLDSAMFASSMVWVTKLERGDPGYLRVFEEFLEEAASTPTPRFAAGFQADRAGVAAFQGNFTNAEESLLQARDAIPERHLFWWMLAYLTWTIRLQRGDLTGARELLPEISDTGIDARSLLARQLVEEGDFSGALDLINEVRADLPAARRRLHNLIMPAVDDRLIAQIAAVTKDPELIAQSREAMAHLRGTWSVDLYGVELGGPIDFYLGGVERAAGNTDLAVELFDAAATSSEAMSTRYWLARSRIELLDTLGLEHPRAQALRQAIGDDLRTLDLPPLSRRAQTVLHSEQPPSHHALAPVQAPTDGPNSGEFRRQGGVWLVGFNGSSAPLADAKGLGDLHTLIAAPGTEVPSTELLNPGGDRAADAALRQGGDPVLDDTAREQYRKRLAHLDAELDAAGAADQTAARAALLAERTALINELRAATGLHGRPRRLGDNAEKARKAVSARIRDALRKIDQVHPPLAAHLRESISTGSACSYSPAAPVTWDLR